MPTCTRCGAALGPEDLFCRQCAAPVERLARRRPTALVGMLVVGVLVGIAGVVSFVVGAGPLQADVGTPAPSMGPPPAASNVSDPTPTPMSSVDPSDALAAQVRADRATAEASVGYWLPQISSKAAGLEVNGYVYDDDRIVAEFTVARDRYDAILVRSEDYSSFGRPGLWVVLVPQRFTDADAANGWCDVQGLAAEDCYAKRLSHTDGPKGNTKHRP